MLKSIRLLLAVLTLAATTTSGAAQAPRPDQRFGVAEGFRHPEAMADIGAGWQRIILPWDQIQPSSADDFSNLGITIGAGQLQNELNRGVKVVGLLEFTPEWAAANPDQGRRSPPINLGLPFDDPNNYWGHFVTETVRHYAGRIDDWVIWNEPEFRPSDAGAGGSYTWLGTDEEFAQLQKVGYLAAKRGNPNATVSTPGTSYWVDLLNGRPQYYERMLSILSGDPDAATYGYFHDVVAYNLYRASDDVYRVFGVTKDIQRRFGIDKPVWLTETNAMPSDDSSIACPHADTPIQTSMEQQASYAPQAFAMAAAAGYQRFEFYQMADQDPCAQPAVWGVTRDDGSRRPVADALRTTVSVLSGYTSARFAPYVRETQAWSPWPDDGASLVPNWQVYQVAFDKPGNQRVSVLWNGDGAPLRVRVRKYGSSASVIDRVGNSSPAVEAEGWWLVDLPAATGRYPDDPPGYYFIGGDPRFLVENGVEPTTQVVAPGLGDPGSVPREFKLFPIPANGQTVGQGQAAEFFVSVRGYEGFSDPVTFRLASWSTQRVPEPQDPSTIPLGVTLPGATAPGQVATVHLETVGAESGIYFLQVEATGGGISKSVDLALVID